MYDIGLVADEMVQISGLINCDLEETWSDYMHDGIKEGHKFEDVKAYIEKKMEQGKSF